MAKLDRLGWAAGLSVVAFGVRVGIRVNNPAMLEQVEQRLPPGWRPAGSPVVDRLYSFLTGGMAERSGIRRFNIVYANTVIEARTHDLDEALLALESGIQLYVAERARGRTFVHAGVVGWQGRAIVIPGRSFSGKSTLVAALVKAGATYYSDEYAVIDAMGRVHPYPKELALREKNSRTPVKRPMELVDHGPRPEPLPMGLVVSTAYRPDARWHPRRLSPGRGILDLLANAVAARRKPAACMRVFHQAVSHAVVLHGARGEAEAMAASLLNRAENSIRVAAVS